MNNFSNNKESKYKDKRSIKNRIDLNPTLTEISSEKTLEYNKNNNNSVSKKSLYKDILVSIKMNKTSKMSHLSEKDLINLQTQKSRSKDNSKNESIDLKLKNNNAMVSSISTLFKESFPKYFKSNLGKNYFYFSCFDFAILALLS